VLYELVISVGDCVYKKTTIGFRNVSADSKGVLLNGSHVRIDGACYVYDSPKYGLVMAREQLTEDLSKMKEANVNAIRTHYPMSDDFYELCDEMGFLVWIEPNIYCSHPHLDEVDTVFSKQEFIDVAVSMTREMIFGAREHASVIIYGIGNECTTAHKEAPKFFEIISQTIRDKDNTRLVGYASLYGHIDNIEHMVDVMGLNSYIGWYDVLPSNVIQDTPESVDGLIRPREPDVTPIYEYIDKMTERLPNDVPILVTEFGADSLPGYYSSVAEYWSEDYHAKVVSETVKAFRKRDNVGGGFVFAFTDYYDPSKPKNGRWNEHNLKGMLSYNRDYKLPFYALKDVYANR